MSRKEVEVTKSTFPTGPTAGRLDVDREFQRSLGKEGELGTKEPFLPKEAHLAREERIAGKEELGLPAESEVHRGKEGWLQKAGKKLESLVTVRFRFISILN